MRLREALDQSATSTLRRVASVHGLPHDEATTRAELIERICDRLSDPTYLQEQLDALDEPARNALSSARDNGGEVRGFSVDRTAPGALEALADRGLLFRTFAVAGPRRGEVFSVPDEVQAVLPAAPTAEGPPQDESPPTERRSSDPVFSLFVIASALARPDGDLGTETRAWAVDPGTASSELRWRFMRHLGRAAGVLVEHTDGRLAASPGLARLLSDPPALADRLWRTYLRDRAWSELAEIGIEQGAELAEPEPLRTALIGAVEQLPPGQWTSIDAFSQWLGRTTPELVREQLDPRGRLLLESLAWPELERRLLRSILCGPLYWLGRVSLDGEGLRFARRASPTRTGPPEPCAWDGAATLIATPRVDLGVLLDAERYLVLQERGRQSRYHLVQQHVAAALGSGGSTEECRTLLIRLTQTDLPASVSGRLETWSERFGALVIRPTVVLEARTEADLEAALEDTRARPFIRRRLGTNVAEVQAADALELATALRQADHLPRVDAALRLLAEPHSAARHASGLLDEQVLEFLLVSLLAFQAARPERLAELEGALSLIERLERQFSRERLNELRADALHLVGELAARPPEAAATRRRARARRRRTSRVR